MKYFIFSLLATGTLGLFAFQLNEETFIDEYDETNQQVGVDLARITFADKDAYITHEGRGEERALRNLPVVSGDYLKTFGRAYAELEFIDGSRMQIADRTEVEFQAINEIYEQESLSVIKLHTGSLFLHVTEEYHQADRRVFRVDTSSGSAYIEAPGIYRVDKNGSPMTLKVYRGFAELSGEADSVAVYSGEYANIRNLYRPSEARPFNSFQTDPFETWAYDRRPVTNNVSAKYVDPAIASYSADLDDQGEWRYEDNLNVNVWVPFVEASWRPYDRGYWAPYGSHLTWVSYDPFGWVTHHYGRWGWRVGIGWYWIPGHYYSPGWVAWTSYNGYVGWCPLGYWNRPYYYYENRPNIVIVNNHHDRWRYVASASIANHERTYARNQIRPTGPVRITTRRVFLDREDFRNGARITRVISDPKVNRQRAATLAASRKPVLTTATQTRDAKRIKIEDRNTGTRAVSRRALGSTPSTSRTTRVETDSRVEATHRSVPGNNNAGDRSTRTTPANRSTETPTRTNRTTPSTSQPSSRTTRENTSSTPAVRSPRENVSTPAESRTTRSTGTRSSQPAVRTTQESAPATRQPQVRTSPPARTSQPAVRTTTPPPSRSTPAVRTTTPPPSRSTPAVRTTTPPPAKSTPPPRATSTSSRSTTPPPTTTTSRPPAKETPRSTSTATRKPTTSNTRSPRKPPADESKN